MGLKVILIFSFIVFGFFHFDQYALKIKLQNSLQNNNNSFCLTYYSSIDPEIQNKSSYPSLVFIDNNKCATNFLTRKLSATQIFGGYCKAVRMLWNDDGTIKIICSRISGNSKPNIETNKFRDITISYEYIN